MMFKRRRKSTLWPRFARPTVEALEDRRLLTLSVGVASNLSIVEGSYFNNSVAMFTEDDPLIDASYSATIDWGDGTGLDRSAGIPFGSQSVAGSHTYAAAKTYHITVTVTEEGEEYEPPLVNPVPAPPRTASNTGSFPVSDASIHVYGVPTLQATAGVQLSNVKVATLSDDNWDETGADLHATVVWGDPGGTTENLVIRRSSAGQFDLIGSHTYKTQGNYNIVVDASDDGGQKPPFQARDSVAVQAPDKPLTAHGFNGLTATSHVPFTGTVASFTDSDPNPGQNTSYTAVIDWGDGTPTTSGTISSLGGGKFNVSGTHTYAKGAYTIKVTVTDKDTSHDAGGATASASSSITVAPNPDTKPLTATGTTFLAAKGVAFTGVVASFTDADPVPGAPSAYGAVISWGDSSPPTVGTVVTGSGSGFNVKGTHAYANPGQYQVSVTVKDNDTSHDDGGSSATATSTATVLKDPYYIDASGNLFQISASGVAQIDTSVRQFAVAKDGTLFDLRRDHTVNRRNGGAWQLNLNGVSSLVVDGTGLVFVLCADHNVYSRNGNGWAVTLTCVSSLVADSGGYAYALTGALNGDRSIYRCNGSGWQDVRAGVLALVADSTGYVFALFADHNVYSAHNGSGWSVTITCVSSLVSDSGGYVYALTGAPNGDRSIYRCNGSGWQDVRANVMALVADGSGYVFALFADHNVYSANNGSGWSVTCTCVSSLVADSGGYVYALTGAPNGDRSIYRCNGSGWQDVRAGVLALVADSTGYVFALFADHNVYSARDGSGWAVTRTCMSSLVSDISGNVYALGGAPTGDHAVYQCNGSPWQIVRTSVSSLVVDGTGLVFVLGFDHNVYSRNGDGWAVTRTCVSSLVSDGGGYVYALTGAPGGDRSIYRCNGGGWQDVRAGVAALAADGSGYVYAMFAGQNVYSTHDGGGWALTLTYASSLVADVSGNVYALTGAPGGDHSVYQCNGSGWQVVRTNVQALLASASGYVYALGFSDQTLYRCNGGDWQVYATGVQSVTGDPVNGATWTDLAGVTHPLP